jgi:hypothetical protein
MWKKTSVTTILSLLVLAGCSGGSGDAVAGDNQADTQASAKKSGVIKYGVSVKGTFKSESEVKTFTFVAQKGWNVSLMLRAEGCGKPIPNTPACSAPWAPHLVVSQSGKTIFDGKGDLQTGDVIRGFTAAQDGTYTLTASIAETDGASPLNYLIELDPPDLSCAHASDCQVHIDGRTIDTGLECAKSAFPDEDGDGTFCAVKGAEGDIPVK